MEKSNYIDSSKLIEEELTESEKKDRNNVTKESGLVDWNEFPMNELAEYLENQPFS